MWCPVSCAGGLGRVGRAPWGAQWGECVWLGAPRGRWSNGGCCRGTGLGVQDEPQRATSTVVWGVCRWDGSMADPPPRPGRSMCVSKGRVSLGLGTLRQSWR